MENETHEQVVKMLRQGENYAKIKEVTNARYKEIKRIQRADINPHFK